MLQQKVSDSAVIRLIKKCLDQEIMSEMGTWTPEAGVPQGAVLSPMLSNIYLNPLDHNMAEQGFEMVRYADDFVGNFLDFNFLQRSLMFASEFSILILSPVSGR